jgi:hypothetical protein
MEKRSETRYTVGQPVAVTILSGQQSTHPATVVNSSSRGIALEMPVPVAYGAALKIQVDDTLLLGEAMHCSASDNRYTVGVLLEAKLSQLSRLAQVLEAFADGQPQPRMPT